MAAMESLTQSSLNGKFNENCIIDSDVIQGDRGVHLVWNTSNLLLLEYGKLTKIAIGIFAVRNKDMQVLHQ
jgi:hypothetical protein